MVHVNLALVALIALDSVLPVLHPLAEGQASRLLINIIFREALFHRRPVEIRLSLVMQLAEDLPGKRA